MWPLGDLPILAPERRVILSCKIVSDTENHIEMLSIKGSTKLSMFLHVWLTWGKREPKNRPVRLPSLVPKLFKINSGIWDVGLPWPGIVDPPLKLLNCQRSHNKNRNDETFNNGVKVWNMSHSKSHWDKCRTRVEWFRGLKAWRISLEVRNRSK